MRRATACFSIYSLMSMRTRACSSSKRNSASARAVSAAPYDPGPAVSIDAARSVVQMAASGFRPDETDRPGTRSGAAIRPPVRTVEEQIAILRGDRPMPAVEIFGDAG